MMWKLNKLVRIVGQARANFAMTLMTTCYNLKRLVYLKRSLSR